MSAPWMDAGLVHDTADRLYEQAVGTDSGKMYASAVGMIETLVSPCGLTERERLDRIADVVKALDMALVRRRMDSEGSQ